MQQPAVSILVVEVQVQRETMVRLVGEAKRAQIRPARHIFLSRAKAPAEAQRSGCISAKSNVKHPAIIDPVRTVAFAFQIIPALGKVIDFGAQLEEVVESEGVAQEETGARGFTIAVLPVGSADIQIVGSQSLHAPAARIGEVIVAAVVVVATQKTQIVDVELAVQRIQTELVNDPLTLRVAGVKHATETRGVIHVAGHQLQVQSELAATVQIMCVYTVHNSIVVLIARVGADIANGLATGTYIFVQNPGHAEIPANRIHRDRCAVCVKAVQFHVIFECPHGAVAPSADLTGCFESPGHVRWLGQLEPGYDHIAGNVYVWRATDATGVHNLCRLREKELRCAPGTRGSAALHLRS